MTDVRDCRALAQLIARQNQQQQQQQQGLLAMKNNTCAYHIKTISGLPARRENSIVMATHDD